MPLPGSPSASGCFGSIEQATSRLKKLPIPGALKIPLRIVAGILPAIAGSFLFKLLAPLFVLSSIAATYAVMSPVQDCLFGFSPKEKQWAITLPVHILFLVWAAMLALFNNAGQIGQTVGGMVLIAAVSIWPVYMGKKAYKSKRRKVPFKAAFAVTAAIIILQQALIVGRRF
jgi:uncharacterized membrane protein